MVLSLGRPQGIPATASLERLSCRPYGSLNESWVEATQRTSSRASTSCPVRAGVAVDRLPLSSYKFPQIPSGRVQPTSLEAAVKDAVVHLDQAPFLQLQRGGVSARHCVDDATLQDPQIWGGVAQHLRERLTESVLLLHPLDCPAADRQHQTVSTYGEIMTGITNASHQSRLRSFAELVKAGATTADFSGHVGECCDEVIHSQVVPFYRRGHDAARNGAPMAHSQQQGAAIGSEKCPARYWGVVLQSQDGKDTGCYVLKTSQSAVGDCTCVHWSLTRVCSGAPLFDQISSAWLLS